MINYIIQVLLFQTLFLAVYDLFLKKETFFQWNRLYLILTSIIAYAIPFIKINSIGNYVQEEFIIPEVFINPEMIFLTEVVINKPTSFFTLENFYFLGFLLMTVLFLYKISQIIKKIHNNQVIKKPNHQLVILKKENSAFSFFNYIFLGDSVYQKEHKEVLKHELIHVKQKHSLDLIFFEMQKIVFWFNPFSYLFQNRISTLHEYIADAKTIKTENKTSFFENLLNQTFNVEKITFVNNYYKQSLLKKRIIMATKNKSKQIIKLKYLVVIPVLLLMLIYTSCSNEINENNIVEIENIIPYKNLDQVPYLANTKETDNENRKMELLLKLTTIPFENINYELIKNTPKELKNEKYFLLLKFIVDQNGNNTLYNKNEIPKYFLSEAEKLIMLIPKIIPGEKDGKKVNTTLVMALITNTDASETTNSIIPFSQIDKIPVYPGCENFITNKEKSNCLNRKIKGHISENFDVNLAQNLGLSLGKKRISVQFIINKNGEIEDVKSRAPHPKLQEEAIRIIELLPKMKAGEENGKKVKVRYNLPITFNIEN